MSRKPDFGGWATKNDLLCADGRIIRRNAFKDNDGQTVPLVYMHQHHDPLNVLGHCELENRPEGVYAYGYFNDTESAQHVKAALEHGDISSLSIYANKLVQKGNNVLHGAIREVSIVLAGANPGAYIENTTLVHGEGTDEETYEIDPSEAVIFSDSDLELYHADDFDDDDEDADDNYESEDDEMPSDMSVQDIIETMTPEQQDAMYYVVGAALEDQAAEYEDALDDEEDLDDEDYDEDEDNDLDDEDYDEDEDEDMRHNVFEGDYETSDFLSHDDMQQIFQDAARLGSLRDAVDAHMENGVLMHANYGGLIDPTDTSAGVTYATGNSTYGLNDMDMLFPEFRNLNNPPEWIRRPADWVAEFFSNVHRTPFSRIKSQFADLTEDAARAKGYLKGHLKKEQVFSLLKRTTDPQTIYKKQKLDRDDTIDVTDFDVVAFMKGEMRGMLDEEIARAILIGDGRLSTDDDKIQEAHIRPIAKDDELFTIRVPVTAGNDDAATAKAIIRAFIKNRKNYKGSGNLTFFTTEDWLSEMLLLEDGFGHALYNDVNALATKLRVSRIVPVQLMEGQTVDGVPLVGIAVDLKDYNVGADKGGAVSMFDDFDIDYNQMKYLIETRCSGALIRPFSAIVVTIGGSASHYSEVENPTGSPVAKGYYVKEGDVYVLSGETTVDENKTYYEKA